MTFQTVINSYKQERDKTLYTKEGKKKRQPEATALALATYGIGYKVAGGRGVGLAIFALSVGGLTTLYNLHKVGGLNLEALR